MCLQIEPLEARLLLDASSEAFVSRLFDDVLQRPPDSAELESATAQLDRGVSRTQVALGILDGPEYQAQVLGGMYQSLLGQPPDPKTVSQLVRRAQGPGRLAQDESQVLGSAAYYQRAGGRPDKFLDALFRDVLGRPISASEKAFYSRLLKGGARRSDVAARVLGGHESRADQVEQLYVRYLDRPADFVRAESRDQRTQSEHALREDPGGDPWLGGVLQPLRRDSRAGGRRPRCRGGPRSGEPGRTGHVHGHGRGYGLRQRVRHLPGR